MYGQAQKAVKFRSDSRDRGTVFGTSLYVSQLLTRESFEPPKDSEADRLGYLRIHRVLVLKSLSDKTII